MNIPSSILTLVIGIVLTLVSLWYGQNHGLLPVAASKDAQEVDAIFNLMMTISTGLFLLIEGVLIFCVIRFRRRKGDQTDGPAIEGNVPLEIFWTAIPTVIVFILAVYSFEIYNNLGGLDPAASRNTTTNQVAMAGHNHMMALGIGPSMDDKGEGSPLIINVNGIQYAWIFTYPETGIVSGELHVPVNRPVQLKIAAGDVIHAFWVPQLRLKQDAIPGRETTLGFTPNLIGTYPIICAELCGAYHGGMKSTFYVETGEDYSKWVQANAPEKVAVNPTKLNDGEYLAPYAEEMGLSSDVLAQLHSEHNHEL
ncbi:cytochrome c oxidase subunit II [Aphanothece hegewaldii CCALA 016]|uniref:Cytochrome c oxidase subunit 2 n=1 Tax=Aphanothece hegewaldii CCALA 016 TaxID=2107694 RepID=A0A2T1M100_9CHRO|nr:cytochrome c oxidase subunit II [Aphanothece hegewaldii]PSF38347.1 cytochrome c oxidase subunit II [Aphanothece hegewaldii CCALA 016]